MSVVEKTFDGVLVRLGPHDRVKLEKTKLLDIATFKCECGEGKLTVSKNHVTQAGKGPPSTPGWIGVKEYHDWIEKWNDFHKKTNEQKLDFVEYHQQLAELNAKRHSSELEWMNKYNTNITVNCPICHRYYSIPIEISSPLEQMPQLDVIDAYKKLGFDLNKKLSSQLLARIAYQERFEVAKNLLKHLDGVSAEHDFAIQMIAVLQQSLENFIKEKSPPTEGSQAWVRSITDSLKELNDDFSKESQKTLRGYLNIIVDYARTWREVTE